MNDDVQKTPTFLIVGAAKSGTTSVYHYLNSHPQIFMPVPKEPKFISSQFVKFPLTGPGDRLIELQMVKSRTDYYQLFEPSARHVKELGDASADNLYYYEQAIPLIKKEFGDPKILIFLRNPVHRAFSAYSHLVREGRESLDFREALDMEEERTENNYEFLWHYKKAGLYSKQVEAYQKNFTRVKIFLFEDLVTDKEKVVMDVLRFLEVAEELPIIEDRVYNFSGKPKSQLLFRLLKYPNPLKSALKLIFPKEMLRKARRSVDKKNISKMHMNEQDERYLIDYYRHDIYKLENLLKRNLSTWLNK